ncbi:DUF7344 domain-containing protein [Halocatena pleomorpha]|uniref:DUF7344 domain-containing protein n=1 Tax=Halocatena pleomorpha TaxID=1785090 RepID=A0A3P3RI97_9EURY|nr:hypothetical protein [Halocatena pleomorpha]RRJ32490.1 hypothetical protein EIK79_04495 [Halocatena pleomorpha]
MEKYYESDFNSFDPHREMQADRRRHCALHCLHQFEDPLALADLAEEVAVREHDASIAEISAEEVKRVYMSLYHDHISELEDKSVIHYNQDRDVVALAENGAQLAQYLDHQYTSTQ